MGVNLYRAYDELLYKPINIVIPMAGAGSRFAVAGYDVPKPFIEFEGKMMIEHVLASFKRINAVFTLIMQEKFLSEQKNQVEKLQEKYKITIVTVPKLTMGAAITALAAHKAINPEYDIIFADSDILAIFFLFIIFPYISSNFIFILRIPIFSFSVKNISFTSV